MLSCRPWRASKNEARKYVRERVRDSMLIFAAHFYHRPRTRFDTENTKSNSLLTRQRLGARPCFRRDLHETCCSSIWSSFRISCGHHTRRDVRFGVFLPSEILLYRKSLQEQKEAQQGGGNGSGTSLPVFLAEYLARRLRRSIVGCFSCTRS